MERTFDRLFAPDSRDLAYPMRGLMGAAPSARASRYWNMPTPLDQGSEGACVGFGTFHFLLCGPTVNRSMVLNFTPQDVYHEAQKIDEWEGEGYSGTSVRAGMDVLRSKGVISGYYWASGAAEVVNYLIDHGPVVLATNWTDGMDEAEQTGVARARGAVRGGHCYLAMGASRTRGLVRCVNSWGPDWAEGGRFWLPVEDLDLLLRQEGEAVVGLEVKL